MERQNQRREMQYEHPEVELLEIKVEHRFLENSNEPILCPQNTDDF